MDERTRSAGKSGKQGADSSGSQPRTSDVFDWKNPNMSTELKSVDLEKREGEKILELDSEGEDPAKNDGKNSSRKSAGSRQKGRSRRTTRSRSGRGSRKTAASQKTAGPASGRGSKRTAGSAAGQGSQKAARPAAGSASPKAAGPAAGSASSNAAGSASGSASPKAAGSAAGSASSNAAGSAAGQSSGKGEKKTAPTRTKSAKTPDRNDRPAGRNGRTAAAGRNAKPAAAGKKKRKRKKGMRLFRAWALRIVTFLVCLALLILLIWGFSRLIGVLTSREKTTQNEVDYETLPDYVTEDYLTVNPYSRPGIAIGEVTGVVIHYTANPGATAQQNRDYFEELATSGETHASSNFVIGIDGEVIACVPLGELAYASNSRNTDTISVECCHEDETGEFSKATYDSLVKLTAWLCNKYGISSSRVIRHYDVTGKLCPKYYVENPDEWKTFIQDVSDAMKAP